MESYWEDSTLPGPVKFENHHMGYTNSNNSEDDEYGFHGSKKKLTRDPLSHRIIEKRRRDRMNSCLADLSRLIPHEYMKKGRGRVEKTEIIEMAIRRIKHLMSHPPCQEAECRVDDVDASGPPSIGEPLPIGPPTPHHHQSAMRNGDQSPEPLAESYRLGFAECLNETIHFLVQAEGLMVADPLCSRLRSHLSNHCDTILQNESLRSRLCCPNGLSDEKPAPNSRTPPPPPAHLGNSLPQQEVPEHTTDPSRHLHDLSYSTGGSVHSQHHLDNDHRDNDHRDISDQIDHRDHLDHRDHIDHMDHRDSRQMPTCGACAVHHESSSDASTGGHTNNHSPTSWHSEKPMDNGSVSHATYKFKNKIQKRFERTEMVDGADTRFAPNGCVTPSTLVPIFALAPSGCHYYASWIEAGAIPSYLGLTGTDASTRPSRWLSAHSVTISVDFSLNRNGS
ncbi:Hairy Orange [Nesidiocoris tenuis]|uniref:Hairy Orange n=1 Tax=Nesidiocoris tenuis TaxID=355587 RepID=A0ABN7BDJ5_9HEMI|nr:Hairy Orange [Nesidiocoris tenuis]